MKISFPDFRNLKERNEFYNDIMMIQVFRLTYFVIQNCSNFILNFGYKFIIDLMITIYMEVYCSAISVEWFYKTMFRISNFWYSLYLRLKYFSFLPDNKITISCLCNFVWNCFEVINIYAYYFTHHFNDDVKLYLMYTTKTKVERELLKLLCFCRLCLTFTSSILP